MNVTKVAALQDPETFLSKVFEILDSYDFDRFPEVFATSLEYQGGLQKDEGLESFTQNLKKQLQIMPAMKTSHARFKNDVTNGTIYSSGTSTAIFDALPDSPSVTIPMIGRFDIVTDGPEAGKISKMYIYKDRVPFLPFIQKLPGMSK
ncbi:hypothetical protein O1611_g4061 [Lasiodiplodia mahajangana]|uniref:Uncharacterized protein n=1 Tax=Lasiodiplodia mahajangana TaxID=1108764 RepID=A0ACC2JQH6_9PEZI|nr:hypothetical protein O1611_g4061 [Lasiodiplodia mahajangana]